MKINKKLTKREKMLIRVRENHSPYYEKNMQY